jgi:hypothetical protein
MEAERESSGRADEQDSDREGPQSGPENPAFRHHCTAPTLKLYPDVA